MCTYYLTAFLFDLFYTFILQRKGICSKSKVISVFFLPVVRPFAIATTLPTQGK